MIGPTERAAARPEDAAARPEDPDPETVLEHLRVADGDAGAAAFMGDPSVSSVQASESFSNLSVLVVRKP